MSDLFKRTKLDFVQTNFHYEWCTLQNGSNVHWQGNGIVPANRQQEIKRWLSNFLIVGQPFAVLDDTFSGESLINSQLYKNGHVVLCQPQIGFDELKLAEARQVLLNQKKKMID